MRIDKNPMGCKCLVAQCISARSQKAVLLTLSRSPAMPGSLKKAAWKQQLLFSRCWVGLSPESNTLQRRVFHAHKETCPGCLANAADRCCVCLHFNCGIECSYGPIPGARPGAGSRGHTAGRWDSYFRRG